MTGTYILIKSFPVTTGRKTTPTPTGGFMVVYKEQNRPFYKKHCRWST
ncbi:L,D-transpeptidase [Bacillus sp. (in: firmicutes)]